MMTIASMEFSDEALDIFIEPSLVCTLACTWLAPVQSVDNYRLQLRKMEGGDNSNNLV